MVKKAKKGKSKPKNNSKKNRKKYERGCYFCGNEFDALPFRCHRCEEKFCGDHRLPESHNCDGLNDQNRYFNKALNSESQIVSTTRKDFKQGSPKNSSKKMKKDSSFVLIDELLYFLKWIVTCTIGVFIALFVINQLNITNSFAKILFISFIVSIVVQIVRSHDHKIFVLSWFLFYFLVYAFVIWLSSEFILSETLSSNLLIFSLLNGFFLGIIRGILQKVRIKNNSLPWTGFVILLILIVGNLSSIEDLTENGPLYQDGKNSFYQGTEVSDSGYQSFCPDLNLLNAQYSSNVNPENVMAKISYGLTKDNIWNIENDFRTCYIGRYKGQFPDHIYCDDLVVSRWETNDRGTINYKWYTAVTSEWAPIGGGSDSYKLSGFLCENGQRVTVEKGVTNYYVYDSKDGTQIRIKY